MENMLLDQFNFADLTHRLNPNVPTWSGSCGFCLEIKRDYDRVFRVQQIKLHAGVGTHMDAPAHRFEGGLSIAEIPLEKLIAPLALLDVSGKAGETYLLSREEIEAYESLHGQIAPGSLVIAYTGWSRFWTNPESYSNRMRYPAVSEEAARLLLERNVVGLGIDTLSPDRPDSDFPVHRLLLGAGKYLIENVADCAAVPPKGSFAMALPLFAEEAAEAPIRLLALTPKSL